MLTSESDGKNSLASLKRIEIRVSRLKWAIKDLLKLVSTIPTSLTKIKLIEFLENLQKMTCGIEDTVNNNFYINSFKQQRWKNIEKYIKQHETAFKEQPINTVFAKEVLELVLKDLMNCIIADESPNLEEFRLKAKDTVFDSYFANLLHNTSTTKISCFISYAWGISNNELWVRNLANRLDQLGIKVFLDIWYNKFGSVPHFTEHVNEADYILIVGTPLLRDKWLDKANRGYIIKAELEQIFKVKLKAPHRIIKLLLDGINEESFPTFLESFSCAATDFTDTRQFGQAFFNLLIKLYESDKNYQNYLIKQSESYEKDCQLINHSDYAELTSLHPDITTTILLNEPSVNYGNLNATSLSEAPIQAKLPELEQDLFNKDGTLSKNINHMADFSEYSLKPAETAAKTEYYPLSQDIASSINTSFSALIPLHNLPLNNKGFTGREVSLQKLQQTFEAGGIHTAVQAIIGPGGMGKTELALAYAWRSLEKKHYEIVWWLSGLNTTTIQDGYLNLADVLNVARNENPAVRIQEVKYRLARRKDWLIIIDDAQDYQSIQPYIPTSNGCVLITSRSTRDWDYSLELNTFTREESVIFLANTLKKGLDDIKFCQRAEQLAELLGDLPLALAQAARFIKITPTSVSDYLEMFKDSRLELWQIEEAPIGYKATVKTTWSANIDELPPQAKQLLNYCSYLTSLPIPQQWLKSLFPNKLVYLRALSELTKSALVRVEKDEIIIHQLVQFVVQDNISTPSRISDYTDLLQAFNAYCVDERNAGKALTQAVALHIKQLIVSVPPSSLDHQLVATSLANLEATIGMLPDQEQSQDKAEMADQSSVSHYSYGRLFQTK